MFSLRSSVLRMAVVVAAIVAVSGATPGLRQTAQDEIRLQRQGARILQETDTPAPSAPSTTDDMEMMSFAPTPAEPMTDAPTSAPTSADREVDDDDTSGAASWAPSSLLSPAAIFVGSVAAAVALV